MAGHPFPRPIAPTARRASVARWPAVLAAATVALLALTGPAALAAQPGSPEPTEELTKPEDPPPPDQTEPGQDEPGQGEPGEGDLDQTEPGLDVPTEPAEPVEQCVPSDERLAELSGLAADADHWYAVGDGGRRLQVLVLRKDCTLQRVITAAVDPFDIEDMALGQDGKLWLADIGDNNGTRETVALHVLSQDGAPELYRLTYPDGPHDAEALLLDADGEPYIVTKETLGSSSVYRPAEPLTAPGPTMLELVTSVRFPRTDTPGGPVGQIGSSIVTGGATSQDATVVALRTYTDAYLFDVSDGDLVAALDKEPIRVPLPDEPQGEAIAFEPDGSLLSASEQAQSGPQPIRAVADAATLTMIRTSEPPTETSAPPPSEVAAEEPTRGPLSDWQAVLIAVVGAVGVMVVISRLAARRQPEA